MFVDKWKGFSRKEKVGNARKRGLAGHLVLSKMSIRHLVHAKRSLKIVPVQNVHEHTWSMPNGIGWHQISRTSGMDQMSPWMFSTGPDVFQG